MKKLSYILLIIGFITLSCNADKEGSDEGNQLEAKNLQFDKEKWSTLEGRDYPYREEMFEYILYNDSVRNLIRAEILDMLGTPNRSNEEYIYYTIDQKRLGIWPLHTKTLVIKFTENDSVDWIKVHE